MTKRYYAATFTDEELNLIFTALRQFNGFGARREVTDLVWYLDDVKEEGDRAMKEEQHEHNT